LGVMARTYSREEWSKLSYEQRQRIKELRKKKKTRKDGGPNPRNTSAVEQGSVESENSGSDNDDQMDLDDASIKDQQKEVTPPTRRNIRAVTHNKG